MDYTRSEAKAWAQRTLHGFYEAPFTPLTAQYEIDERQLAENIERYIALGVDGLVVGGFVAELWAMTSPPTRRTGTYASRIAMMKPWMDAIGFPVGPVMPPVRALPPERQEYLGGRLRELGVA